MLGIKLGSAEGTPECCTVGARKLLSLGQKPKAPKSLQEFTSLRTYGIDRQADIASLRDQEPSAYELFTHLRSFLRVFTSKCETYETSKRVYSSVREP